MSLYKNTGSHVEKYNLFKEYEIESLLNCEGELLSVEDAHFFADTPICHNCFFEDTHGCGCSQSKSCGSLIRNCSGVYRRDGKDIIYKRVEQ